MHSVVKASRVWPHEFQAKAALWIPRRDGHDLEDQPSGCENLKVDFLGVKASKFTTLKPVKTHGFEAFVSNNRSLGSVCPGREDFGRQKHGLGLEWRGKTD